MLSGDYQWGGAHTAIMSKLTHLSTVTGDLVDVPCVNFKLAIRVDHLSIKTLVDLEGFIAKELPTLITKAFKIKIHDWLYH